MRLKAWSFSFVVLMPFLLGIAVSLTANGLQAEKIDVNKKGKTPPKPAPHKPIPEKDLKKVEDAFRPKPNVDHKQKTSMGHPPGTPFEPPHRKNDTGKVRLQEPGSAGKSKSSGQLDHPDGPSHGELHHVHTLRHPEDPCAKAGSPEKVEACRKAGKRFQPSK